MGRAEQTLGADAVEPRLRGLAALLLRCAEGEPGATAALRHWDGGRLQQMLARMLDDPERVRVALDRLLADLSGGPGAFRGNSEAAAQDWLFARMRLAVRQSGGLPPLRTVPRERAPEPPPQPAVTWAEPRPTAAPREPAASLANPRLRPPSAPVRSPRAVPAAPPSRRARRVGYWLGVVLLLLAASGVGLVASVVALRGFTPEWPIPLAQAPAPAPEAGPVEPAAPPPEPPAPTPAPSVEELIGPPLAARDLPVVSDPIVRAPPADPPPEPPAPVKAPGPAVPRVVIHHGAGADSFTVAEQLAAQLGAAGYGEVEVRPVPFDVATASVRYFYGDDRAGAERLVRAIGPFLSWHGRAAPSTPIGFTDFRPLPRQGTLEIWLPRR